MLVVINNKTQLEILTNQERSGNVDKSSLLICMVITTTQMSESIEKYDKTRNFPIIHCFTSECKAFKLVFAYLSHRYHIFNQNCIIIEYSSQKGIKPG